MNMLLATLFVALFLIATFNYNLPILTKGYKGISKHRFREWLFFGLFGRMLVGILVCTLCRVIVREESVPLISWCVTFALLAVVNVLWTCHEIIRDQNRLMAQRRSQHNQACDKMLQEFLIASDYLFDGSVFKEPEFKFERKPVRTLFIESYREMRFEVTSRFHAAMRTLDHASRKV
jgi:uncharacterized protein YacL